MGGADRKSALACDDIPSIARDVRADAQWLVRLSVDQIPCGISSPPSASNNSGRNSPKVSIIRVKLASS